MLSENCKKLLWHCLVLASLASSLALAESANNAGIDTAGQEESPEEIFDRAQEAMDKLDVREALYLSIKSAEQNHLPAQVFLGEYYDIAGYDEMAVGWFMSAAFQGSVDGAFGLGKMYASGEGVEKNNDKALFWLRFAADRNHLAATTVLYNAYKNGGIGLAIDLGQAKIYEDKLPALQEATKKERKRKRKLQEIKAKELAEKRKAEKEARNAAFIEEQKREKNPSTNPEETDTGSIEQGSSK